MTNPAPLLEGYRIEESAKIYLLFDSDNQTWTLDPVTCDGHPLDGLPDGSDCDSHYRHIGTPAHEAAHEAAEAVSLPTALELLTLLAQHFNLQLTA